MKDINVKEVLDILGDYLIDIEYILLFETDSAQMELYRNNRIKVESLLDRFKSLEIVDITEDQIIDAGIEYQMTNCPMALDGDAFYEACRELNRNRSFEAGAKWALKQLSSEENN